MPIVIGRVIVAMLVCGALSGCAVGDGVAHVVKLGVQATQGSNGRSERADPPHGAPPPAQAAGDRSSDAAPPPLPGADPVAPVVEEGLPPLSPAKP